MNPAVTRPLLSVAEVAERLSLSERTIRARIAAGDLPAIRLGDGPNAPVRISEDALNAYVSSRDELTQTRKRADLLKPVFGEWRKERLLHKLDTPEAPK